MNPIPPRGAPEGYPIPVRWPGERNAGLGDATLTERAAPLFNINLAFLQLLVELSRDEAAQINEFVVALAKPLRALKSGHLQRIARTPFLLLELEFRNEAWWKAVSKSPLKEPTAGRPWLAPLPRTTSIKLARLALMLAWHLARSERESCLVLLGMSSPVTETIGFLQPQQLDRIAEQHYAHLRPRWEDRPDVWRELLSSGAGSEAAMRAFALYALRLTWGSAQPSRVREDRLDASSS